MSYLERLESRQGLTRLARRSTCNYGNPAFVDRVNELTSFFGGPGSTHVAQALIYQQLNQQADGMAQDIYRLLWWFSIGMIAYAFLLSKNRP